MSKLKNLFRSQLTERVFIISFLLWPLHGTASTSCSVTTVPVNFGTYNVYTTTNTTSTGQVSVNCNPTNTSYTVALNGGTYGTIAQRKQKLSSGSDLLNYNLYSNPAATILWGDGSTNGTTVTSSSSSPLNVYGVITALQNVGVGSYSDSVSVTVTF